MTTSANSTPASSLVRVGFARGGIVDPAVPAVPPAHDPLEAVAVWFEGGATAAALVALDLPLLSFARGAEVRAALGRACGLPAESIVLHFTHTHTGPQRGQLAGLEERLGRLLEQARAQARPARLAWAEVDTQGRYNLNRRQVLPGGLGCFSTFLGMEDRDGRPDGGPQNRRRLAKWLGRPVSEPELQGPMIYDRPADTLLQGVFFRDDRGRPLGALARFASHPTPAGHTTERRQSADFPAVVRARLRHAFGGECAYLTGPCGNLAPWERGDWVYNDPTPQEDPAAFDPGVLWWIRQRDPRRAWAEVERIGNGLADALIPAIPAPEAFQPLVRLRLELDRPALPLRGDLPGDPEAVRRLRVEACAAFFAARGSASPAELKALADRVCRLHLAGHRGGLYGLAGEQAGGAVTVDLPALRLNDLLLMGFPGETFWETPQAARQAAARRGLGFLSFTLANGSIGYIPTEAERPLGDYEVHSSLLADGAEAKLEQAAQRLAERMAGV